VNGASLGYTEITHPAVETGAKTAIAIMNEVTWRLAVKQNKTAHNFAPYRPRAFQLDFLLAQNPSRSAPAPQQRGLQMRNSNALP
jgi:hypothetical protein